MGTLTKAANANTVVSTGWTNPTNAYGTTTDAAFATAVPAKNGTISSDYGFPAFTTGEIPDHSTLTSVVANVDWKLSAVVTGGTLGIQSRRNSTSTALGSETTKTTTAEEVSTQTATGATLTDLRTANEIRARVRCSKGNTTSALTGSVDYVSLTVTWTEVVSAAAGNISGSATPTAVGKKAISKAIGAVSATPVLSATGVAVSPKNVSAAAGTISGSASLTAAGRKARSLAMGNLAVTGGLTGAGRKAGFCTGSIVANPALAATGVADTPQGGPPPDPPSSNSTLIVRRRGCCAGRRIIST